MKKKKYFFKKWSQDKMKKIINIDFNIFNYFFLFTTILLSTLNFTNQIFTFLYAFLS